MYIVGHGTQSWASFICQESGLQMIWVQVAAGGSAHICLLF